MDNNRPHRLFNLTNRIFAVVDDAHRAHDVLSELVSVGVSAEQITVLSGDDGLRWIDANGTHGGTLTRVVRGFQQWTVEGEHLRQYARELADGRCVIDIHTPPFAVGDRALLVLRKHGAHFINAYHQWTIEPLAA